MDAASGHFFPRSQWEALHCSDWLTSKVTHLIRLDLIIMHVVNLMFRRSFQQRIQPANGRPPAVTSWLHWWWTNQLVLVWFTFLLLVLQAPAPPSFHTASFQFISSSLVLYSGPRAKQVCYWCFSQLQPQLWTGQTGAERPRLGRFISNRSWVYM